MRTELIIQPAVLTFLAVIAAGCQQNPPSPAIVEPAEFASWPPVTERPVRVGAEAWAWCRGPSPEEAKEAARHGPHLGYTITVRVSPGAEAAFREGRPLPAGAVVVKEKFADPDGAGPLQAYAVMAKREPGYFPDGGDWEYAYADLVPKRNASRGRMDTCAGCHASARVDRLFRSYGGK